MRVEREVDRLRVRFIERLDHALDDVDRVQCREKEFMCRVGCGEERGVDVPRADEGSADRGTLVPTALEERLSMRRGYALRRRYRLSSSDLSDRLRFMSAALDAE